MTFLGKADNVDIGRQKFFLAHLTRDPNMIGCVVSVLPCRYDRGQYADNIPCAHLSIIEHVTDHVKQYRLSDNSDMVSSQSSF
uniref:Uncharacterized protein n=1 Tax=Arundo donax TaxID=35708 RepID=A0A0A9T196_ARUDO